MTGRSGVIDRYRLAQSWRLCGWPTRLGTACRTAVVDSPGATCRVHQTAAAAAVVDRREALDYVMATTLVSGRRREILPCECGALLIAGLDHTCDPHDRAGDAAR